MSQGLGPVHFRMFEKIRALDARTHLLLAGNEEIKVAMDASCGVLSEGPLDAVVDLNDIHGWLANQVAIAENRHAYAVHHLLAGGETVESLKEKQQAVAMDMPGEDMQQSFFLLDEAFLDGMPCDRSMAVTAKDDVSLCFTIDEDAHGAHWTYGTPVSVYEELRFDAMEKQAKAAKLSLDREAPFRYVLRREEKPFGIAILNEEHRNILDMTRVLRALCIHIMDTGEVPAEDLRSGIRWVRDYADKHHHGKEEVILFREMVKYLGPAADKLVNGAMLIEHDMGRFHMQELEKALDGDIDTPDGKLDIITHAAGYAELLARHAAKEDDVVYPFAQRGLSTEVMELVNKESRAFEEAFDARPYLEQLEALKSKYL